MTVCETARAKMIDCQLRPNKVTDERIIDAFARLQRELFVPEHLRGTFSGLGRKEVVDYIRFNEIVPDQLDNIVLINHYGALSGTVPIARLVIANSEQRMDELRFEPIVSVHPDANEKEVFDLFDKYNLRGLTVIDADNRPIGAITVDDVVSRMNAKL